MGGSRYAVAGTGCGGVGFCGLCPVALAQEWSDPRPYPRFEPSPCPDTLPALKHARCGFLVVPENRAEPGGRARRNIVAIVPAVSKTPEPSPVVYLTGGPGGIALLEAQRLIEAGLNREHVLILMNQRGTFETVPELTCPRVDKFNARAVGRRLDSDATRRDHVAATAACRRHLINKGIDLGAYNTLENAADFADLRRVLGYDDYNLYGVSYGTDLALTILRRHPEGFAVSFSTQLSPRNAPDRRNSGPTRGPVFATSSRPAGPRGSATPASRGSSRRSPTSFAGWRPIRSRSRSPTRRRTRRGGSFWTAARW